MKNKFDITGFGAVAIDELLYVDGSINDGKARVLETRIDYGGNVGTALVAAASLGANVSFIGALSSDPAYVSVVDDLVSHGVDITRCSLKSTVFPVRSTIVVGSNGERFIAYRDADIRPKDNLAPVDWLGARVLLVDSHAANSLFAVKLAVDCGLQIVADIEWSSGPDTDELMAMTQHLVVPMEFAKTETGSNRPEIMLSTLWSEHRRTVVITDGANGAYLLCDKGRSFWHVPANKIDVLDTTGCGDWFHGAYAVALSSDSAALERVRFATAAAGIAAEGQGGRGKLATLDEVNRRILVSDPPKRLCP